MAASALNDNKMMHIAALGGRSGIRLTAPDSFVRGIIKIDTHSTGKDRPKGTGALLGPSVRGATSSE